MGILSDYTSIEREKREKKKFSQEQKDIQLKKSQPVQVIASLMTPLQNIEQVSNPKGEFLQGIKSKFMGYKQKAAGYLGMDDDVNDYESGRQGIVSVLKDAVGETGVLTNQDISRIQSLLPDITDTLGVRYRKMNRVINLLNSRTGRDVTNEVLPTKMLQDYRKMFPEFKRTTQQKELQQPSGGFLDSYKR